jgi:hypothetical protein
MYIGARQIHDGGFPCGFSLYAHDGIGVGVGEGIGVGVGVPDGVGVGVPDGVAVGVGVGSGEVVGRGVGVGWFGVGNGVGVGGVPVQTVSRLSTPVPVLTFATVGSSNVGTVESPVIIATVPVGEI